MSRVTDPAEQAAALVDDPDRYEEFAGRYSDEVSFYAALRANAQRSLSFEEYVELRWVFLDRGPTEAIRNRVEERLERSLKNMVLGDSPRGRAYRARTLAALEARRQRFATLDITVPTLRSAVQTTVEHCYDAVDRPGEVRETLGELLAETPPGDRAAVEYVARAWLTEVSLAAENPAERLESALSTYVETVPAPDPPEDTRNPDDNGDESRDAAAYRDAAARRSFADPAKRRLQAAAVHADPSVEALGTYLYLRAADDIEAYRHGDQDVTRADFIVARRHLRLLRTVAPFPEGSRRAAYVDSYFHLARAIERGGGRWLSTRAGTPAPAWETVADEYARAATAIRPVDARRFVKYLSKAFRHAAHATDEWTVRSRLHVSAQQLFDRLDPESLAAGQDHATADLRSAIRGTLQVHRCRAFEARAHLAFETTAYDEVSWAADRARTAAAEAPQDSLALRELATLEAVAAARRAERRGEFETALSRYDAVETDDDALRVGVACHRQLCRVKQLVVAGDHETALERVHEWFEPGSAVVAATEFSCGLAPAEVDPTAVSDQFLSLDTDALSAVPSLVRLADGGGAVSEALRRQVQDCLVAL